MAQGRADIGRVQEGILDFFSARGRFRVCKARVPRVWPEFRRKAGLSWVCVRIQRRVEGAYGRQTQAQLPDVRHQRKRIHLPRRNVRSSGCEYCSNVSFFPQVSLNFVKLISVSVSKKNSNEIALHFNNLILSRVLKYNTMCLLFLSSIF